MTNLAAFIFPVILALPPILPAQDWRVSAAGDDVSPRRVAAVERMLPEVVASLAEVFPGTPTRPFRVYVHEDADSLPEPIRKNLHEGTPGLAILPRHEIHLLADQIQPAPPNDVRTVLTHEVAHVFLHQAAGEAGPHLPRWFHEGIAQHLSGDVYLGAREQDLLFQDLHGRLLHFSRLETHFPSGNARRTAYAQSFSFVRFLVRKFGMPELLEAARRSDERHGFATGFARVTGDPLRLWEDRWKNWLRRESGASWRFVFDNCFSYIIIVGFVLLALASIRKLERDQKIRTKLDEIDEREREEQERLNEAP